MWVLALVLLLWTMTSFKYGTDCPFESQEVEGLFLKHLSDQSSGPVDLTLCVLSPLVSSI